MLLNMAHVKIKNQSAKKIFLAIFVNLCEAFN